MSLTIRINAQLSGLYTINNSAPSSSSNYTSFTSLSNDLNSFGVSGAVTVNVVANTGPYIEQVTFNQFTGSTATNSVLINGNGNTITFAASTNTAAWTLLLNGTDYMAITNLTVTGTGTYAWPMMLVGGADYNTFSNCRFAVPANVTSTGQIPVCISGSNTSYSNYNNSGNYNTFNNCTMYSGYCSVSHFGYSGLPYNTNNNFIGCNFLDWGVMSIYALYAKNITVSKCNISRPTRSTYTSTYGLYIYYCQGALIEKNRIYGLFDANPGYTGTLYGAYLSNNPITSSGVQTNSFVNNIINVTNFNGTIYGTYNINWNGNFDHNTVNIDMPGYNYTGSAFGYYGYGALTTYPVNYRNNIITMNLGGTGTHYAFYCPSTSGFTMTNNNIINYRSIGTNSTTNDYHSYWNGTYYDQNSLLAAGANASGTMLNPYYLNPNSTGINNFMPSNAALNNQGVACGILQDNNNQVRGTVPDVGAIEFLNTACSGAPALTSIQTPTSAQCPGVVVNLSFANSYTTANIVVQWLSSTTSSVGPFSAISGSTTQAIITNSINQSTWYTASVTCLNSNQSITNTAGVIQIAGTTTNTVPYYEGFEGIGGINKLPNCSWYSPNIGYGLGVNTYTIFQSNNRLPHAGNCYATFDAAVNTGNPAGTWVFTNGIYLVPGVSYSASVWYQTDGSGSVNWNEFSLWLGSAQTASAMASAPIASVSPAVSPIYSALSGTFTVSSAGIYYTGICAKSNGTSAPYLTWDDLSITAPCSLVPNTPTVTIVSSATNVCSGNTVSLTASGANTYSWNSGINSPSIIVTPTVTGVQSFTVAATKSLTGCSATNNVSFNVSQSPTISINSGSICNSQSFTILPSGANTYTIQGGNSIVSPSINSTYSVIGSNTLGCLSQAAAICSVVVNPNPTITVNSGSICAGGSFTLLPSGAATYSYSSGNNIVNPNSTTVFSVVGTSSVGCVSQSASTCTVIVNQNPTISVNSGAICVGQTFSIVPSGANTYTYQGGNSLVTPTANSTFTVIGTNIAGCVSQGAAVSSITVNPNPIITVNSGSICAGGSFTLLPSGAATYSYSSGNNIVNPNLTTVFSVVGTNNNGCTSQSAATSTVTVIQNPTISVNSGSICVGQTFSIIPNGANTYTYQGGSSVVTPSVNSTFTVNGTNLAGCVSQGAAVCSISVNPNPTITASDASICNGQSYTIIPGGANTYTFQGGSAVVSPTSNMTYSIIGTSNAGCVSFGPKTISLTVNANPTITINSGTICSGQNFTFTPSGAASYTYSSGSNIVNPSSTSLYSVTGTSTNGCLAISAASSTVVVLPIPNLNISGNIELCLGEKTTLRVNGATSYTWNTGSFNNSITITPTITSTYTVNGINANNCINNQTVEVIISPCTGLEKTSMGKLEIYPNPSSGRIKIKVPAPSTFWLMTELGQRLRILEVEKETEFDLGDLAKGIYYIISKDLLIKKKLVIVE